MTTIRILLVDEHEVMRESFALLLDRQPDFVVCSQCANSRDAFSSIQKHKPDLAIIGINLSGNSGLELIKNVHAWDKNQRILVLSTHDESIYAERALRAGASGYVMKSADVETVIAAIRTVLSGKAYLSRQTMDRLMGCFNPSERTNGIDSLSDRELEIFTLTGKGYNTPQTAKKLGLSPKTVETHRSKIKQKLHLGNGADLFRVAVIWAENEKDVAT